MKKAIYKITNNINKKIYIGQSNNPNRRFQEHLSGNVKYKNLLKDAIKKYGKENFTMEILEWTEDFNKREQYYISILRSLSPYGYNIEKGGSCPPIKYGEDNCQAKITKQQADKIKKQLQNWSIPRRQIIKSNKVTNDIVRHINDGSSWYNENLNYPLRPQEKELNNMRAEKVIELLQNTKFSQKEIAKRVGWTRSAITMINNGSNHYKDNLTYPIRK